MHFLDRMRIERDELYEKTHAAYLKVNEEDAYEKLGKRQYRLLVQQLAYMNQYYLTLCERIKDIEETNEST